MSARRRLAGEGVPLAQGAGTHFPLPACPQRHRPPAPGGRAPAWGRMLRSSRACTQAHAMCVRGRSRRRQSITPRGICTHTHTRVRTHTHAVQPLQLHRYGAMRRREGRLAHVHAHAHTHAHMIVPGPSHVLGFCLHRCLSRCIAASPRRGRGLCALPHRAVGAGSGQNSPPGAQPRLLSPGPRCVRVFRGLTRGSCAAPPFYNIPCGFGAAAGPLCGGSRRGDTRVPSKPMGGGRG